MPTILYEQGFYFSFFSADRNEPPHVHVRKERAVGKWWLSPIVQARSRGFTAADVRKVERVLSEYQGYLLQRWHDHFSQDR